MSAVCVHTVPMYYRMSILESRKQKHSIILPAPVPAAPTERGCVGAQKFGGDFSLLHSAHCSWIMYFISRGGVGELTAVV